jgi:hypothetical protein
MDDGDLPKLSRSWNTAFRRFSRWCANGVGLRIFAAMAEDAGSGHPSARSMIVRAHQQAAGGKGGLRPLAAPAAAWPARPRSSWPAGPAGGAPDLLPGPTGTSGKNGIWPDAASASPGRSGASPPAARRPPATTSPSLPSPGSGGCVARLQAVTATRTQTRSAEGPGPRKVLMVASFMARFIRAAWPGAAMPDAIA